MKKTHISVPTHKQAEALQSLFSEFRNERIGQVRWNLFAGILFSSAAVFLTFAAINSGIAGRILDSAPQGIRGYAVATLMILLAVIGIAGPIGILAGQHRLISISGPARMIRLYCQEWSGGQETKDKFTLIDSASYELSAFGMGMNDYIKFTYSRHSGDQKNSFGLDYFEVWVNAYGLFVVSQRKTGEEKIEHLFNLKDNIQNELKEKTGFGYYQFEGPGRVRAWNDELGTTEQIFLLQ